MRCVAVYHFFVSNMERSALCYALLCAICRIKSSRYKERSKERHGKTFVCYMGHRISYKKKRSLPPEIFGKVRFFQVFLESILFEVWVGCKCFVTHNFVYSEQRDSLYHTVEPARVFSGHLLSEISAPWKDDILDVHEKKEEVKRENSHSVEFALASPYILLFIFIECIYLYFLKSKLCILWVEQN